MVWRKLIFGGLNQSYKSYHSDDDCFHLIVRFFHEKGKEIDGVDEEHRNHKSTEVQQRVPEDANLEMDIAEGKGLEKL